MPQKHRAYWGKFKPRLRVSQAHWVSVHDAGVLSVQVRPNSRQRRNIFRRHAHRNAKQRFRVGFPYANVRARRVSLPRWHQVIGGFNDSVVKEKREKKAESDPLLWVFSNVMDDSTAAKVENLRDSLQLYAHRPRIIVTSNANPRAFMNRLRIGAAAHLYVR
jgi:hypothetical protein